MTAERERNLRRNHQLRHPGGLFSSGRPCEVCMTLAEITRLREAQEWVLANISEIGLGEVERATLTQRPNQRVWFSVILPDLDYEIRGGTFEEPRWAWEEHPWFQALGLTRRECEDWFAARRAGGRREP